MTVLLGILKVIGIILLVILAVVLLLVLFILLSPIRYESTGSAGPTDIQIRLKVSWLCKILGIKGSVTPDKIRIDVRVLFLHVFRKSIPWHYPLIKKTEEEQETEAAKEPEKEEKESGQPKMEKEVREKKPKKADKKAEKKEAAMEASESKVTEKPESSPKPEAEPVPQPKPTPEPKAEPVEGIEAKTEEPKEEAPKEPFSVEKLWDMAEEKTDAVDQKIEEIRRKLDEVSEKVDKVRDILEQKSTWKTVDLVKRCVFRLIRHILPKQVRLRGLVGTGDPSLTAKILGVFYMGYPLYGDSGDYRLKGDFENKILKGKYYVKGRILLALPVLLAIRLFLNKNIRRLIFRK